MSSPIAMACDGAMPLPDMARTCEGDRGPGGAAQAPERPCNRWKRQSDRGIFARMMAGPAAGHGEEKTVMTDATSLKAHRTASGMGVRKGARTPDWPNEGRHGHQPACHLRQPRPITRPVRHRGSGQRSHRGTGFAEQPAECRPAPRGPRPGRRPVQGRIERQGMRACIPRRKQRKKPVRCDTCRCRRRNRIEIMSGRLKDRPIVGKTVPRTAF